MLTVFVLTVHGADWHFTTWRTIDKFTEMLGFTSGMSAGGGKEVYAFTIINECEPLLKSLNLKKLDIYDKHYNAIFPDQTYHITFEDKLIKKIHYKVDDESKNELVLKRKNGKISELEQYVFDQNSNGKLGGRLEIMYSQDKIDGMKSYQRSLSTGLMELVRWNDYIYSSGKIEIISYNIDFFGDTISRKITHFVNSEGLVEEIYDEDKITQKYEYNQWNNVNKMTVYDRKGITEIHKREYQYDRENFAKIGKIYDGGFDDFESSADLQYFYDKNFLREIKSTMKVVYDDGNEVVLKGRTAFNYLVNSQLYHFSKTLYSEASNGNEEKTREYSYEFTANSTSVLSGHDKLKTNIILHKSKPGLYNVSFAKPIKETVELKFFSVNGKMIKTISLSDKNRIIDLRNVNTHGMYIVKIDQLNWTSKIKL